MIWWFMLGYAVFGIVSFYVVSSSTIDPDYRIGESEESSEKPNRVEDDSKS